jgi:hypothetical protein
LDKSRSVKTLATGVRQNFTLRYELSVVAILEIQELATIKNRKAVPTPDVKRDPFEFALSPSPIIKLIAKAPATLEKDLVCAPFDLVVSWSVVHKCFFSRLSGCCVPANYCCHPRPNAW